MRFIDLARKRSSIRGFRQDPVAVELLDEILEAGRLAPTAKNLQPFHFVVVQESASLEALAASYPAPFFRDAPVVIVTCVEEAAGWTRDRHDGKNYAEVDAAIAMDHMTLAATDLELGTCWIGAFNPEMVCKALQLPEGIEPLAMLLVGHPNAEPREKVRKPLDELVHQDRW